MSVWKSPAPPGEGGEAGLQAGAQLYMAGTHVEASGPQPEVPVFQSDMPASQPHMAGVPTSAAAMAAGAGMETDAASTETAAAPPPAPTPEARALRARQRRKKLRRLAPALLVTLLYLVLSFLMFRTAAQASLSSSALSLRYYTALTAQQAAAAKHYWANPDLSPEFTASYWHEAPSVALTTARGEVKTPALIVDGDMAAVLPVEFLQGGYPSALESRGLAMSEGLAWKLFGGTRVVGSTLTWNKQEYTVRGVFAGEELRLLAQVDAAEGPAEGFEGVELAGSPEGEPREAAKSYVQAAGLPVPDVILGAQTQASLLWAMAWLPAVLLILWFAWRMLVLLHHSGFWPRQVVWLALLFLLALAIPRALEMLPGWVIPTNWSDFNHWSDFFQQLRERVTEWMSVKPAWRDVALNQLLILQAALLLPTLLALFATMRRWAARMRRQEARLRAGAAGGQPTEEALDEEPEPPDEPEEPAAPPPEEEDGEGDSPFLGPPEPFDPLR